MRTLFLLCTVFLFACGPGQRGAEAPLPLSGDPDALGEDANFGLFQRGIDFHARGQDPDWWLEMDMEGEVRFFGPDGYRFVAPASPPVIAMDAPIRRYRSLRGTGSITITLREEACPDTLAGLPFTHAVTVAIQEAPDDDEEEFEGCGRYVAPTWLHDIWVLQTWEGAPIDTARLARGAPVLEFHTDEQRVMGHSGCNTFTGSFAMMEPGQLQFGQLASTLRACPDMTLEDALLRALSGRRLSVRREGLLLIFSRREDDLATWRKVD